MAVGWWRQRSWRRGQEGKHWGEAPHLHPALFLCHCICQPSFLRPLVDLPHCIVIHFFPWSTMGAMWVSQCQRNANEVLVLSYLTEFTIVDFSQCTVEGRTVHIKLRKQEKVLRIQSIHYKVWSINSIIPSTQLTHQHSYSITFFPPWALFYEQRFHSSGKFVRSTWIGVLRTIILSEVLLPYFLHLQNIASWPAGKAQGPVSLVLSQRLWEMMWVWKEHTWEFGVWVSSLFEQVSSRLLKVKVLVLSCAQLLTLDRKTPGSSVREIL